MTGQVAHTDNPSIVGAGPTYTEAGTHRQTVASSHSNTTVTIYRAVTTEPHAEIVTPYTMRITLEADDTPHQGDPSGREADEGTTTALDRFLGRHRIVEEHGVGDLREHVPLSLMEPTSTGPRRALPAPDPRTDPALTRAPGRHPCPPYGRRSGSSTATASSGRSPSPRTAFTPAASSASTPSARRTTSCSPGPTTPVSRSPCCSPKTVPTTRP